MTDHLYYQARYGEAVYWFERAITAGERLAPLYGDALREQAIQLRHDISWHEAGPRIAHLHLAPLPTGRGSPLAPVREARYLS